MTAHDERPLAVVAAEAGAGEWRAAVVAQRSAVPEHADFYSLAGEVVGTLRALSGLTGVLAAQVAEYGQGRVVRDDTGYDPAARLAEAAGELALVQLGVDRAERAANRFWSAISHIATEVTP
jgi:hypothetical protein